MLTAVCSLSVPLLAAPATAKLWGWPDDFAFSTDQGTVAWARGSYTPGLGYVCPGWGTWCDMDKCDELQTWKKGNHGPGDYVYLQKENAAWMDLWRIDGTDTFNMLEKGGDGTVQGQ